VRDLLRESICVSLRLVLALEGVECLMKRTLAASRRFRLLVCRLKPPDDAHTLPNLKVVAINQLLGPPNSLLIVVAVSGGPRSYLRPSGM
jgi:hypothetical protein